MDWRDEIGDCIDHWDKKAIVVSPDVDGFLTAAILSNAFGSKVVGYYNARSLYIERGFDVDDCIRSLWLDHDIDHSSILCIGQHLISGAKTDKLGRRNDLSFNPNVYLGQDYNGSFLGTTGRSRDKYPFGTAHLFVHMLEDKFLRDEVLAMFCHSDSTRAVSNTYPVNSTIWLRQMFDADALKFVGMDGEHFDLDDTDGDLDSGVWSKSPTLEAELDLVWRLREAHVKRKSAAVQHRELNGVPEELRGTQSVNISKNMKAENISRNIKHAVSALLKKTNFSLDIGEIDADLTIHGEFHRVYPSNRYENGALDEFLDSHHVFSHAFVSRSALQFTTMVDTMLFE